MSQDGQLRLLADMENLRTRKQQEIDNAKQFGLQKIAKELVDVADILEVGELCCSLYCFGR